MNSFSTQELELIGKKLYTENELAYSVDLASHIQNLQLDRNSIILAFLMSLNLKDTTKIDIVKNNFGEKFIEQIELLQRIGSISIPDTSKKIQKLRQLFIELTNDLRIIIIKLTERLVKLKHCYELKSSDLEKIAEECLYLYSPIAHRLGIRKIYTQMEDISFRILFPQDYQKLNQIIEKNRRIYEQKLNIMKNELKNLLIKSQIEALIQSRVKRLYSIFLKIKNKNTSIDEIYDLMALRVITDTIENCYYTLGLVHQNWIPIEGRFRDWVSYPKPNGYRSIQTTIATKRGEKFEIQIRTNEMHREAEYGSAAHWAYKEGIAKANDWTIKLKEFLENDEYFENPYVIIDKISSEIKRDYINVLTPKGEVITLPEGSTAIDFAYQIHTQLGNQIIGARINGKFAKPKSKLNSGDVIEIITSKNAKPSRDWLNFVKTAKARSKILIWIKKNESEKIIFEGKRVWEKFKKTFKKKLEGFDDEHTFKNNLNKIGFKSEEDFYSAIAIKSIKLTRSLLRKLYPDAFIKLKKLKTIDKKNLDISNLKPKIIIEGLNNIETQLAKCCNPIKGQEIVAYITKNSLIKIHSIDCPFLNSSILDKDRLRKADWLDSESKQIVRLRIYGQNYDEMLTELIEKSNELKISIIKTERIVKNEKIQILTELEIKDFNQLKQFQNKLINSRNISSFQML